MAIIDDLKSYLHKFRPGMFDENFLGQVIQQRMKERNLENFEDYVSFAGNSEEERQVFGQALLVSYSEFFRNPLTFAVLGRVIIPDLIFRTRQQKGREIRIWSTASSIGQEAYSLAILMKDTLKLNGNGLNFRIFSTDINENVLIRARQGIYPSSMLGQVPLRHIERYFQKERGNYRVVREIQDHVEFTAFDLLDTDHYCPPSCIYGDFDIVVCSNLLFYYNDKARDIILAKVTRCLQPGGILVTGEVERDLIPPKYYSETHPPSAIFVKTRRT